MAEKKKKYIGLIDKIDALIDQEISITGNLAGIAAVLKQEMDFFWVGFYLVKNQRLEIGPYQGPLACIQIDFGKGVCGKCWKEKMPIIVNDVDSFNGHIACNPNSKSEIVIPIFDKHKNVEMVLDVDSEKLSDFSELDEYYLLKVAKIAEGLL
mgnify:CR=1 FL=1